MMHKPVCKVRIPPAADKATVARVEAKALMRGLLDELGVPALVAKVEKQEAELHGMREANNYLFQRLQAVIVNTASADRMVHELAEALLDSLTIVQQEGEGEEEPEIGRESRPIPSIDPDRGGVFTEEQSQMFLDQLLNASPPLLERAMSTPRRDHGRINRIDFSSMPIASEDEGAENSTDTDGGDEDPIGDLEM